MRASSSASNVRSHAEGSGRHARLFENRKHPEDPRALLQQIAAKYPDREKCLRIFVAVVLEDQRCLRAVVEHVFNDWTSRTPS
jgi:hypothetical protein